MVMNMTRLRRLPCFSILIAHAITGYIVRTVMVDLMFLSVDMRIQTGYELLKYGTLVRYLKAYRYETKTLSILANLRRKEILFILTHHMNQ